MSKPPKTTTLTVNVSDLTYNRLVALAKQRNTTVEALASLALKEEIARIQGKAVPLHRE